MGQTITTTQVDNRVLPQDDADYIAPGEPTADEAELAAQQQAEAERQKLEAEAAQRADRHPDRPVQNYEREMERLRQQREKLRSENEAANREREQLRAELERYRARQEVEHEAQERLVRLQKEAQRPDPETDPYGAQLWDMQQELQAQKRMREQWEQAQNQQQLWQQQQQQTQSMLQDIQTYVVDDVNRFKSENPDFDYDAAAQHVKAQYVKIWQSSGLTPQEAEAVTANTFLAIGRSAQLRGHSAAATIAEVARLTGWNGQAAASASPQQRQETGEQRVARIAKAQKLQGIGGKTPGERTVGENIGLITAQQLAEMDDDTYLRLKQDPQTARLLERRLEELG